MIYSDLIINKKIWSHLFHIWKKNKLPNAFLFHGSMGIGKEAHAIELAALLNCDRVEQERACGNCFSCKKIISFQHESIKLILPFPRGKIVSKSDSTMKSFKTDKAFKEYLDMLKNKGTNPYLSVNIDGSNTILINSIREIRQNLSMSIEKNQWRVVLIFQAEKLCLPSPDAAHALLKILEEPPENTIMILVSSKPDLIIDTIHSRCQSLYFSPISDNIIKKKLEHLGQDANISSIIAKIVSGNIALSYELANNYSDIMEKLYIFLNSCFSRDAVIWQKNIDILSRLKNKSINNIEQLFQFTILFFRDLLLFQNTHNSEKIIYINQIEKIKKLCALYPKADWQACIQHIENTKDYITRNGFLPLMIINLIIDIQKSIKGEYKNIFELSEWIEV